MGVVNITPDSFSDGGRFLAAEAAIAQAERLIADGADLLDLGAESTRPGAEPVTAEEELARLRPVLQALAGRVDVPLSVDTMKPAVAEECLRLGATILNDITGARDERMLALACAKNATIVLMHMRGTPRTMQQQTEYNDVVADVANYLAERAAAARAAGIANIIIDPGLGFAKTAPQSMELLRRLDELQAIGCPILVGVSRKSFLGAASGCKDASARLPETVAAITIAALQGAEYVRVHDVAECRRALAVADAVRNPTWTVS